MPCNHKFQKYLNLDRIDFEPTTLIVGSFTPEWPDNHRAEWFYGSTEDNCFWDVLPRLYGVPSLINATPAEWEQFCHDKQIAITDLISSIDDADPNDPEHLKVLASSADQSIAWNFDDFTFINIVQLLQKHPAIKNVYLTRGVTEAFWRHVWNPVMRYCNLNNLRERKLLTPSVSASYQHGAYNNDHPGNEISALADYILMRWQQDWHL